MGSPHRAPIRLWNQMRNSHWLQWFGRVIILGKKPAPNNANGSPLATGPWTPRHTTSPRSWPVSHECGRWGVPDSLTQHLTVHSDVSSSGGPRPKSLLSWGRAMPLPMPVTAVALQRSAGKLGRAAVACMQERWGLDQWSLSWFCIGKSWDSLWLAMVIYGKLWLTMIPLPIISWLLHGQ